MNKNFTYHAPIFTRSVSTRQDEKWDEAVAQFNDKMFDKVLPTLLDYIGNHLQKNKEGNTYSIAHGSVVVQLTQTEDQLIIKCPFLNIADAKKVPLMRRLAELRMYPLNLTNIELDNDLVYFSFSCPIYLGEPYKIYSVLREICIHADRYDDEFIEKFGAQHLQEPKVKSYPAAIKQEAYSNCLNLIEEGLARFDYYMETRHGNNAWYALNITLKKLEFFANPQGYLRTLIELAIDRIYDRNVSFHDRLLNGKASLEQLKNYSEEQFLDDLYEIETFIPYKYSSKKENIRENWEDSYNDAQQMIAHARFEDAAMLMQSCFYGLFYYNLVSEEVSQPIEEALEQSNGLDWNQAASILMKGMEAVMEDNVSTNDFGMDLSKIMGEQMQQSMAMVQQMMANLKTN